jgi:hypothetical protein
MLEGLHRAVGPDDDRDLAINLLSKKEQRQKVVGSAALINFILGNRVG